MALPQIVSRNQAQKIQSFEINSRITLQPNTAYTCPTGKKAIVKGSIQCDSLGAAAIANFLAANLLMFSWNIATQLVDGENYIDTPRGLSTFDGGMIAFFEVELSAGDIIETTQDSGTNASFNLFAGVIETDA